MGRGRRVWCGSRARSGGAREGRRADSVSSVCGAVAGSGCRQRAPRDTTVRAQEEVYRGQGKYTGVWEMLCSEGDQIGGRPEVFRWRGEEYRQPVYDAQGIATVRHAVTDEVLATLCISSCTPA